MSDPALIVACIAAAVSLVTLLISARLTETNERRKVLWEHELSRFFELEDHAGCLVDDLLAYRMRDEHSRKAIIDRLQYIQTASGRFRRHRAVTEALHKLHNSAGWFLSRDMKHDTKQEFEEARSTLTADFAALIDACDEALKRVHKRL